MASGASETNQIADGPAIGGLWTDARDLFLRPGVLFARLPEHNRSGPALTLLILLHWTLAAIYIGSGVPDFEVDVATEAAGAKFLRQHEGDEDLQAVDAGLDAIHKNGAFQKLAGRLLAFVGPTIRLLFSVGALTGVLFVVAALTMGKPQMPTLAGIAIFSNFVDMPRAMLRLWLTIEMGASRTETSLAAFATEPGIGLPAYVGLRRFDPFEIWGWALVAIGLWKSRQLRLRPAIVTAVALAFVAGAWNSLGDVALLAQPPEFEAR